MIDRPKNQKDEVRHLIGEAESLINRASSIVASFDDELTEETWQFAVDQVTKELSATCESLMDGRVLVELVDNGETIVRKFVFTISEIFERSTFEAGKEDNLKMVDELRKALEFAENLSQR